MNSSGLVSAWIEEANSDFRAAKLLMEADFHCQAVFLSQQAFAKALKSLLLKYQVPEGTGRHPSILFGELLKKPEGNPLRPFEKQLLRLLNAYRNLEKEAGASRFPKETGEKIFVPKHEFKKIHSVRAITYSREIIGLCEKILGNPVT